MSSSINKINYFHKIPNRNYDPIFYFKDFNILRLHNTYGDTLDPVVRSCWAHN